MERPIQRYADFAARCFETLSPEDSQRVQLGQRVPRPGEEADRFWAAMTGCFLFYGCDHAGR
eukprot:7874893-Pyramimonas_sp.AAC.1